MPFAYFYGRVSHENSANKKSAQFANRCDSVDVQLEMAKRRFEYDRTVGNHPELVWGSFGWAGTRREGSDQTDGCWIDQVVSAYKMDWLSRPAGGRCWAHLKAGDTLYTAYLDRMFRRNHDQAVTLKLFAQRGVRVVFINENLDSTNDYHRFMIQILSSVSELSSLTTSRRIKEAHAHKRAQGQVPSRKVSRGFKKDKQTKRAIPNDEEREIKLKVMHLIDVEKLTYPQAGERIERELAAAENRRMLPEQAGNVLPARRYSDKTLRMIYNDQKIPLPSRLIPPGTFDAPPGTPPLSERPRPE